MELKFKNSEIIDNEKVDENTDESENSKWAKDSKLMILIAIKNDIGTNIPLQKN
jgi:hypothetical protein